MESEKHSFELSPTVEKILIFTLGAVNFTNIVDFMIIMPLEPQLVRLFAITPKQHAALISAYTFAAGFSSFFAAFMMDRFDRKKALLSIYFCFIVGTLACAFAPTYSSLFVARALTGVFGGLLSGLVFAIVGDVIPLHRRGAAMGTVMAAFSLASIVGVPFGLYLASIWGWHSPFVFVVSLAVLVFFLIIIYMPSLRGHILAKADRVMPLQILRRVIQDLNQVRALLLMFVVMVGPFAVIPFISPFMVANIGFSESQLPFIYLFGGGFTVFTSPYVGRLSDRFGHIKIFSFFSVLILIPLLWITHLSSVILPVALIATTLFFVCSNGRFVPTMTIVSSVVPSSERGAFMGISSSLQSIAAGTGSLLGGVFLSKNMQGQFENYPLVGYWAVFTVIIAYMLARKIKERD